MQKITGRQSKMARSLLKWNLYDLASHIKNIQPKRIDSFEHGSVHLMAWENEELGRAYKKAGIQFKADLEVILNKEEAEVETLRVTGSGEGIRIVLDGEQNIIYDSFNEQTNVDSIFPPEDLPKKE